MHLAHQELIKNADGVVVIERNCGSLTPGYKRYFYTSKPIFFYNFENICNLSALDFIKRLQNDFKELETIIVGYDFHFGKGKEENSNFLKKNFKNVIVIDEVKKENISIHSTTIRAFLKKGDIKKANSLLGRTYIIKGEVIKGQGIGKKELFATINIKTQDYQLPLNGVYATFTLIDKKWYHSISFLGNRITTDGFFSIETHILDKEITLKEENIEIAFVDFIRENRKFNNLQELKTAISNDILQTKEILCQKKYLSP